MNKQVVITGIGVISRLGEDIPKIIENIADKNVTFDSNMRYTEFDALPYLGKKRLRLFNRCTRMLLSAIKLALEDANYFIDSGNEESIGIITATNLGADSSLREMEKIVFSEGPDGLSPMTSFNSSINGVSSQASIRYKIKAFNITLSSGFSAGIDSLIMAKHLILNGSANAVLLAGCEEISNDLLREYGENGLITSSYDDFKPFASTSKGTLLGDGAAVILLEEKGQALARNAHIYGEIQEGLITFYPQGLDKKRLTRDTITALLKRNNLDNKAVDLIMSSGNGLNNDSIEKEVLLDIFNSDTKIFNVKTYLGEGFAFTNVLQIALAAFFLNKRYIPVHKKLNQIEQEAIYENQTVNHLNKVLINSLGMDGTHGAVILSV